MHLAHPVSEAVSTVSALMGSQRQGQLVPAHKHGKCSREHLDAWLEWSLLCSGSAVRASARSLTQRTADSRAKDSRHFFSESCWFQSAPMRNLVYKKLFSLDVESESSPVCVSQSSTPGPRVDTVSLSAGGNLASLKVGASRDRTWVLEGK